jgi:hypothetical protein
MAKTQKLTPQALEALAGGLGLALRAGAAPEMAKAYARLQELAEQVRAAADERAEPAHLFKP